MANPQKENGYTPIANEILDNIMKLKLNGTQFRIVMCVWRYTYGFSRKQHELSESFISKAIDVHKKQVQRELTELIKLKIIVVEREANFNQTRVLSFNKDYVNWLLTGGEVTDKLPPNEEDTQTGSELVPQTGSELVPQDKQILKQILKQRANDFFETIWKLYPNKKGKGQVSDTTKLKIYKVGFEHLARCIERYKQSKPNWQQYQNGSTFFNSGYIDFLDENYIEASKPTDHYRRIDL